MSLAIAYLHVHFQVLTLATEGAFRVLPDLFRIHTERHVIPPEISGVSTVS